MTMPASSTIRMSQINTELGRSSTASISLDTAENGGYGAINQASASRPSSNNPASLSEWYSYNHNAIVLQYTHTLYYASGDNNGRFGFTTSSAACSSTSPSITVYSNSSTITPGMGLYYDQYGNSLVWSSSYNSTNPYFKLNSSLIRLQQNDLEIQVGYAVYDVSSCVAPSVVFNNTYYWSYTSFGQGASGTVIITGSPATFKARGVVINSGSAVVTNITIGGISRSTSRFSTPGTNDSTTFTLSPGTYSYSVTISLPQAGAIGGGIVFTQP